MKEFDTCLLVGRFNTFHNGHEFLARTGLKFADRILIFVGSAQESGTKRNPFNVSTRIKMIKEVLGEDKNIMIYALPDLTHEDDITHDWGRYVIDNTKRYIYKSPDVMIYGNDESRSAWFAPEDIKDTLEIIVPRSKMNISATMTREFMKNDEREKWMELVNPKLHKMYDELRAELMISER